MLSYQHHYHAGNFADVHKHFALIASINYLQQKPKGYTVIDTHAGDGDYQLTTVPNNTDGHTSEAQEGCLALQQLLQNSPQPPELIKQYKSLLSNYSQNKTGDWKTYPGSPAIAGKLAREDDQWVGFEAHPQAYYALRKLCRKHGQMSSHKRDAFEGLQALLPVASGRALIIVDPSYEMKQDYVNIPGWLTDALAKMPQMTIIIWYPILHENRHQRMINTLEQLGHSYALSEWRNQKSYQGMAGSGIFIINPPWNLQQSFATSMDWLCQQPQFSDFSHQWKEKQS